MPTAQTDIVIGKDVLELLSSAMYVDPLSIYREYVQNSADAIDQALGAGLYRQGTLPRIDITLDPSTRRAVIRDNGVGVSRAQFTRTLSAIGASKKRGSAARGFRGVGRLAGLGYCKELLMRSRSLGDNHVSEIRWDCIRLTELLRESCEQTLQEIVREITAVSQRPASDADPAHFFEVELCGVIRYRNDLLLNELAIQDYLSQVGPVPFHPEFTHAEEIQRFLHQHAVANSYSVTLNGAEVYRPYRDCFELTPKLTDRFTSLETFCLPSISEGLDAVGWVLHSNYHGAFPERLGIKGLRVRAGNIQIGDSRLLDCVFPEERFNAWTVGECHITSRKLVPNGRRDAFEQNSHYANLVKNLMPYAKAITKHCREFSARRARERKAAVGAAMESFDWPKAKLFLNENWKLSVPKATRNKLEKLLQTKGLKFSQVVQILLGDSPSSK
ncbi:MAG: ATP-binding protein [Candidatus Sumerlaeaceae bacterium]